MKDFRSAKIKLSFTSFFAVLQLPAFVLEDWIGNAHECLLKKLKEW